MSSAFAIASVTAVLKDLLDNGLAEQGVTGGLGDVTVTALPPDRVPIGAEERAQLNLFLYRVAPNTAWRSFDSHARNVNGEGSTPPLALDLHYLLTAYGEQDFQSEILLGQAIRLFHETAVLTRETIQTYLGPNGESGSNHLPTRNLLRESGLSDTMEQLRIYPEFISMEDASRLWSSLQARYRPSVAYKVSPVLIEGHGQ